MHFRRALGTSLALVALSTSARADEKIVTVTTVQNPRQAAMLKQLSPEERAEVAKSGIGRPVRSTYYFSGNHVRVDTSGYTILIDTQTGTETILNRQNHRYAVKPIPSPTGKGVVTVQPTAQSKSIAGHRTKLYHCEIESADGRSTTAEIWAAPDLPQPSTFLSTGLTASMRTALTKIKGLPLSVIAHVTSDYGDTLIKSTVTSVSTYRLSASTFRIPPGYKPAPAGAGVGAPPTIGM